MSKERECEREREREREHLKQEQEQEQEQKQGGWPHRSRSRSHHPPPTSKSSVGREVAPATIESYQAARMHCQGQTHSRKSMNAVRARDQIYRPCPQSSLRCETEHGNESEKSRTQNPSKPYHMFGPSFLCLFFFGRGPLLRNP